MGHSVPPAGTSGDAPKRSQLEAIAQGSPSVKSYGPRDIRDSLAAYEWRSSAKIDSDLLALAQEIGSLLPEELAELQKVSERYLALSVLPLLPGGWLQTTFEVRSLASLELPYPSNPHLTQLNNQEWFWQLLHEDPTWLLHVPITPNLEPIPILVQSKVKPCPGDNLVLASLHQISSRILDQVSAGGGPQDPLGVEGELLLKVMWAVVRVSTEEVDKLALGAIGDRCYFRALKESQYSLSSKT